MTKIILVNGILDYNSGKTSFISFYTSILTKNGISVLPFKPLSGHSFYFQFENTLNNVTQGNIISQDIQKLLASIKESSTKTPLPVEIHNPSHVLFGEKAISPYFDQEMPRSYFSLRTRSVPLMQRFTSLKNGEKHNEYLIRDDLEKLVPRLVINRSIFNQIYQNASKKEIQSKKTLPITNPFSKILQDSISSCYEKINQQNSDIVIIEGFNNAIFPPSIFTNYNQIDLVLAVAPGSLILCDTTKFLEITNILFNQVDLLSSVTMEKVLDFITPERLIQIPIGINNSKFSKDTKKFEKMLVELTNMLFI